MNVKALYIGDLTYTFDEGKTPLFVLNPNTSMFTMEIDSEIAYHSNVVIEDENFILFKDNKDNELEPYDKLQFIIDYNLLKEGN